MSLRANLRSYRKIATQKLMQARLRNVNFSIISNNCWGGEVYKAFGLPYQSPFVGLFLFAPCYMKLLQKPQTYIEGKLSFARYSRYQFANECREKRIWDIYPIGLLDGEIEVHFMHYCSAIEAGEKWQRRSQRVNWDQPDTIFLKFCDRGLCTKQLLEEFDKLTLKHKVCFTSKNYPELKSTVWIKECEGNDSVVDGGALYQICRKYFNLVRWLNENDIQE